MPDAGFNLSVLPTCEYITVCLMLDLTFPYSKLRIDQYRPNAELNLSALYLRIHLCRMRPNSAKILEEQKNTSI